MAYTAQNLEHAVSVFYSSEHSERAEAHKWLTTAQRCPEAWSFVWELLQSQKGTEIQFFAATTLHTKLQRCWAEVPRDNYGELKNRILEAISMFSCGPKIVLNRLCISLAAFLLQQGGQGLLEAIEQFLLIENASILLEILSVIPEEFNSMTMSASNRTAVRFNLQQLTSKVLEIVTKHLQVDSGRLRNAEVNADQWMKQVGTWHSACQCAEAWLQLGGVSPSYCEPVVTAALQVLHAVYWGVGQSQNDGQRELSGIELEACEAALNTACAPLLLPEADRHSSSCCPLLRLLLNAVEPLLHAEDILHTANEELVAAVYGGIISTGEHHARWITIALVEETRYCNSSDLDKIDEKQAFSRRESAQCAKDLLRIILRCSSAPGLYPTQETHSQLAFGFWYILQDEGIFDGPDRTIMKGVLRGWYEQLAGAILRKSALPTPPATHSAEDAELMRCYRQDVADTFMYCYAVLGRALVLQLSGLLEGLASNVGPGDVGCTLEAVLHAFLALGEAAHPEISNSLLNLMKTLIDLPYDVLHQQVLITALDCFVAYGYWLGNQETPEAGHVVGGALGVAGAALGRPGVASRAALALRALCRDCQFHLAPHALPLLQAVQSGQGRWSGSVALQVLGAAGGAAASLPPATAAGPLAAITAPLVVTLQAVHKQQLSNNETAECSSALKQAASLFVSLTAKSNSESGIVEHARVPLSLLLPILQQVARHSQLAEPLFNFIKLVINNLMDDCIPLLSDISNILNISLEVEPHPSAVEVAKLISLMFPEVTGGAIGSAATAVLRVCSEGLSQGQALSNHAPLLDIFYSSLEAATSKKPQVLQHVESQMPNIIQLGILAMCLPEKGPCRSSCWFLGQLARAKPSDLISHGPSIVHQAIHCIGVHTPRTHIDPFAELLYGLGRAQWGSVPPSGVESIGGPAQLSQWLRDALQQPDFPSNNATPEVKEKFMKAVIRHHGHKRRLIEIIREFALACRGLLGEYGDMTQASVLY